MRIGEGRDSTLLSHSDRGQLWVRVGCRPQANATAGLPPAPEISLAAGQLRLVPRTDKALSPRCTSRSASKEAVSKAGSSEAHSEMYLWWFRAEPFRVAERLHE